MLGGGAALDEIRFMGIAERDSRVFVRDTNIHELWHFSYKYIPICKCLK